MNGGSKTKERDETRRREWIERRQQLMSWVQKKGKGEVKTEWDKGNYIFFYIQGLFQVTPWLWS